MSNTQLFAAQESAHLRTKLEDHLTRLFAAGLAIRYDLSDHSGSEWEVIVGYPINGQTFTCLRSAYHIWYAMHPADRYAVLQQFQYLCGKYQLARPGGNTLTFCLLFVRELAPVLAEAAQWPH